MLAITDAANHCPVFHEFTILPAVVYDAMILGTDLCDVSVTQIAGSAVSTTTAQLGVNAVQLGATAQTGRDVGASVLLSAGTGIGQLDFTSGVVKANLAQILASAISGTAAQISAAFTKFFDKATPTGTINSLPDAVAGATGGLPTTNGTKVNQTVDLTAGQTIAATVAGAVGSVTGNVGGSVASVTADVGITQAGADKVWGTTARTLTGFGTLVADIATAVWAAATRTLSAFGFTVAPTAAANADAVWDEALSGHSTGGSAGAALTGAGSAGDPWTSTLPGAYGAGTAGKIIGDNLNATVSSRSTLDAAGVWGYATRGLTTFGSLVADIATAVWGAAARTLTAFGFTVTAGTVSDKTGYSLATAPPTAIQVRNEMDANSTQLAAIAAKTTNLPASPAATGAAMTLTAAYDAAKTAAQVSDIPTAGVIAAAVLKLDLTTLTGEARRSLLNAIRPALNKVVASGATLTVYKEDDVSVAYTAAISTDVAAIPVTGVDPV